MASCDPYAPDTVAVYRLYDVTGVLLYVGQCMYPKRRFADHAKDQKWWPDVACWRVEWWPSRAAAMREEARVIQFENPLHNTMHQLAPRGGRGRMPGQGDLRDVLGAMRGESRTRTMAVLARLEQADADQYGEWRAHDLKAFLFEHGIRTYKSNGQQVVRIEDLARGVGQSAALGDALTRKDDDR